MWVGDRKQGIYNWWPNRQKIGEMPKSIMSKFWSIIDCSLLNSHTYIHTPTILYTHSSYRHLAIMLLV